MFKRFKPNENSILGMMSKVGKGTNGFGECTTKEEKEEFNQVPKLRKV